LSFYLSLLFFSTCIIYIYLGIYVYRLDRKSILNKLFFFACISLSIWTFAYSFALSAPDAATAFFWRRVAALGWCSVYSILFHFFLVLSEKDDVLNNWWVCPLIYFPAVVLIFVFSFSDNLAAVHYNLIETRWGWHNLSKNTVWDGIFNVYYLTAMLGGLVLTWQWGKNSTMTRNKKQALLIVVTVIAALLMGSVTDIILPTIGVALLPQLAVVIILIPIYSIWYAIKKYKFMGLTIENASMEIMSTMKEGLLLVDKNGNIQKVNRSARILLGYDEDELINQPIGKVLLGSDSLNFALNTDNIHLIRFEEKTILSKTRDELPILFSASPMRDKWGDILGLVCTFSDNTDRKRAEEALQHAHDELGKRVHERTAELATMNAALQAEIIERQKIQERIEYLAYHDYLTDLPNRLLFTDRLEQAILQARRTEKPIAVAYMDLDAFKRVNDTMGHTQGDELLKTVAYRLTGTLRVSDTVARLGGDEFIFMFQNFTDVTAVTRITETIFNCFNQPFELENQYFFMTASLGVSIYPADGENVETLIKNADIAMYKAKDKGRNKCVFCSQLMKNEVMETMRLTNGLYRCLERNELVLYYQPQMNCRSGKIVGMEALLRWQHPELGLVPPGRFIPIAEQTGLIMPIGEWVLRTACKQNKVWQDAGLTHIRIAVNLSLFQFQNPNLVDEVAAILKEIGLSANYLELEITESVLMKETEYIIEILKLFKNLGVAIAIDDFGTEYSSLNYLKELPVDKLKIAMPFVHGISKSNKDEAIIKAIIVLTQSLGLNVIAEGVETEHQLKFLTQLMCDEIQGFYYCKPLPAHEAEKLLKAKDIAKKLRISRTTL
jgi:diguanylate cyclase (GGDEF)-like protein/PAS domain S-box-containing protein